MKSRLQADVPHKLSASQESNDTTHPQKPRGVALVKAMFEQEGFSSFYRGLSSKIFQTVLNSALMFYLQSRIQELVLRLMIHFLKSK